MMKPCRECRREISEQAFACPHCGAPLPGLEGRWGSGQDRAMLAAGLLLSACASYVTYVLIQAYGEMFARFGSELPSATALLLRFYPMVLGLPPLLVLCVWFVRKAKPGRGLAVLVAGGATLFLIPQVTSTIMYLPVFALGK